MNMIVGATLTGTAIPAFAAEPIDPIFAEIEAHKKARAIWIAAIDRNSRLEKELPKEKRKSSVDAFGETIIATDAGSWIESEREVCQTSDGEIDAAIALLGVLPTTQAGLRALLRYAIDADTDGEGWPSSLEAEIDGRMRARSWQFFLIRNLAEAVDNLAA